MRSKKKHEPGHPWSSKTPPAALLICICKLGLGPSDRLYASMWTGQVVHAGCVCIYITEVPFCLCGFVSVTVRNEKTNSGLVRLKIKPFFIGKEQYGRLGVHGVSGKRNPVISQ